MAQQAMQLNVPESRTVERSLWLNRSILTRVLANIRPRDFSIHFWNGETIEPDTGETPRFALVLNRPCALRRMLLPPTDLALGEAYLRGDFEIAGDIAAALRLSDRLLNPRRSLRDWVILARDLLDLPKNDVLEKDEGRMRARLSGSAHSRERDRAAIQYHYDVGNEFFALWLDPRMIYSCAYFKTGTETLDAAQEAKLDLICRKLRLREGETLLDIGCGWGGLAMFAAQRYRVNVRGVTLSEKQVALARERIKTSGSSDHVQFELCDYRDLADASFDKIVSIGMFEHVGRAKLAEYFAQAYRLLKPHGVFLNHGIAAMESRGKNLFERVFQSASFVGSYVFPDGELIPIHDALSFAEKAGFEVRDVESWREHYARTLRHWVSRLESRQEEARRVIDERTYRVWRLYMAGSAYAFDAARINVYQTVLAKSDMNGASNLPWTRDDWYVQADSK